MTKNRKTVSLRKKTVKRILFCATAAFAVLCACSVRLAFGDGKMYVPETVPVGIPFQRAIIGHDGTHELLILQTTFTGDAKEFGWVVPLPAEPQLGGIVEGDKEIFQELWYRTASEVTSVVGDIVIPCLGSLLLLVGVITYVLDVRRRSREHLPSPLVSRGCALILSGLALSLFTLSFVGFVGLDRQNVEVIKAAKVGVYDVKVVKAADKEPLLQWLRDGGYQFDKSDEAIFDTYTRSGWCFVTARVTPDETETTSFRGGEGLVKPLMLYFETSQPAYPLALTGTIGKPTEVVLYVFAKTKQSAPKAFELEFAGETGALLEYLLVASGRTAVEPSDFFDGINLKSGYLTKLRGRLAAEEMKVDLLLHAAPDNKGYRKRVVGW